MPHTVCWILDGLCLVIRTYPDGSVTVCLTSALGMV